MKSKDLYDIAEQDGIDVNYIHCPHSGSISLMTDEGDCYIGIDESVIDCESEKKVCLAHEIGHCETGSFYNRHSKFDIISRHERRADKWAFEHLMPVEEIAAAYRQGNTEPWQLAEYFDLPQWFVEKAIKYYTNDYD